MHLKKYVLLCLIILHPFIVPNFAMAQKDRYTNMGNIPYTKATSMERLYFRVVGANPTGQERVDFIFGHAFANRPLEVLPSFTAGAIHGKKLFGFYGYNIRKAIPWQEIDKNTRKIKQGYYVVSREIIFYTDTNNPEQILSTFENSITGKTNPVFHVQNRTVNTKFIIENGKFKSIFPACQAANPQAIYKDHAPIKQIGNSFLVPVETVFSYPLAGMDLPGEGSGPFGGIYHAAEFFDYYLPKSDLKNILKEKNGHIYNGNMNQKVSWTRLSHWLPWMCMDDRDSKHAGGLLFHAYAEPLSSFDELPQFIKNEVVTNYPEFRHAPDSPFDHQGNLACNDTTWSTFKREKLQNGTITRTDWCAGKEAR